jgi:hypothetical protein
MECLWRASGNSVCKVLDNCIDGCVCVNETCVRDGGVGVEKLFGMNYYKIPEKPS